MAKGKQFHGFDQSGMVRQTMRPWIPAIVIPVLLCAVIFLIRPAPQLGSFTMSDGTVVEVARITTAPLHRCRYDNRWQDYLGYVLPRKLALKLKPHILEHAAIVRGSIHQFHPGPNLDAQ